MHQCLRHGMSSARLRAIALLLVTPGLFAVVQDSAGAEATTADTTDTALHEIVVTAERRDSTVQKTPISITALTGQQLRELGVSTAQGVVQSVPGVEVSSAGPGQAKYEIRGLSSDGGDAATVGFTLDDVPITPPATATTGKSAIDPDLYDLQRVEVLRGPQGTLYGSSSMGGTVKLITNVPDTKSFYGSSESTGSGTDGGGANYAQSFMLNIPVDDRVALRLVGTYLHNSGWIDRVIVPNFPLPTDGGATRGNVVGVPGSTTIRGTNDETLQNYRISLLLKPTDQLTITPSVVYQETSQGGINTYDSVPGLPHLAHYQAFDVAEPYVDRFTVVSLPIVYSFDNVSLTSVTGYWQRRISQRQDGTEQFVIYVPFPAYGIADGGPGASQAYELDRLHQLSQEFRIASTTESRLQWLGGVFYSDYYDIFTTASNPPGVIAQPNIYGTVGLYNVTEPFHVRQEAIFGHGTYNFTDAIKLEAGVRYFAYQSEFDSLALGYLYGGSTPEISSAPASANGVNPMINISDQITPNLLIYASAAKGFREGAGNFPIATTGPGGSACLASLEAIGRTSAPTSFDPDTVWSYEIGEKSRFLDQRITFNADVYDIEWSNVQEPVALSCGLGFTTNGPHARIKGSEAEFEGELARGLTLTQGIGYTDAAFTQSFAAANIVSGEALLNAPRWTINSSVRYERPVSDLTFVAIVKNNYTSSSYDLSYQINRLPSRDTLGLRAGLETKKWSAYVFVDNALNRHQSLENINLLTYTGPPYNRVATNQPLTVGATIGVKF
jgi:iron complex outermembrane recepter protein